MSHPDPEVERIRARNAFAYSEAVQVPPLEIADDPAAYLRWAREREVVPVPRPRPRTYVEAPVKWKPSKLPRQKTEPQPPASTAMGVNAERNRQLNALAALIQQQGDRVPDGAQGRATSWEVPDAEDVPEVT